MTRFTGTNIRRLDILNCEREMQGFQSQKYRTIDFRRSWLMSLVEVRVNKGWRARGHRQETALH